MSTEQLTVLQQAQSIVADQLARLRDLVEHTRRDVETRSIAVRQAERNLDEVALQHQLARTRRAPNAALLGQRWTTARARCDALTQELQRSQHALKQLEQLIRQIEMSSGVLTGIDEDSNNADPWGLALRAQVIHGREQERLRLAREVHDGPAQVLANALMLLEGCYNLAQQTGEARLTQMLDRLRGATKEGLQDVRRFIADLRPGRLEEQGLVAAVADYVRQYANAYNAQVQFDADPLPRLPFETELVLYRIVQEALQNVHKYARGAPANVRLTRHQHTLHMLIRDEGPGFDIHDVARRAGRSSWGLTSMRERAELVGARFTVASRPGYGTEVAVTLPLE